MKWSRFLCKFATVNALKEIQQAISQELEQYNQMFHDTLQHDNPLLQLALDHISQRKGKQMRPMLLLLSAKGGGVVTENAIHAAIALELLHTASLVHDDIVDESDRRRGQQSVNSLLDNKAAVLVGDFLLSKALEHAAATGSVQVFQMVASLGQTLADGELLQLANVDSQEISESSYYEVIRKKTASLFATCAEIGAILSTQDEGYRMVMKRFGMLVGMCFQLRDDIFDYDMSQDVGKPAGNDMKEGKLTLPVIHICSKDKEACELALSVRKGTATDADIQKLVQMSYDLGGIIYSERAMRDFEGMASGLLDDVNNREIAEALEKYLLFVSQRNI